MDMSIIYIVVSSIYAAIYAAIKYYGAHLDGEPFDVNKMVPFLVLAIGIGVVNALIMGTPQSVDQITTGMMANLGLIVVIQGLLNAFYKKWDQISPRLFGGTAC